MSFVSGPIPFNGAALAAELSTVYSAFSKQSGYTSDCIFGSTGAYILCTNSSDAGVYQHSGAPASADYSVFADIAHPNSNTASPFIGVIGRASAVAATFYLLLYEHSSTRFRLYRVSAGTSVQIGSNYTYTLTSTPVRIELRMAGSAISAHLDGGAAVISATNSDITAAGKAGIYCLAMRQPGVSDSGSLDNFDAVDAGGGGSSSITANQGNFSLTGQTANLLFNRKLTAEYGTHSLTGQDANLLFNRLVSAAQGSYALTGQDATLTYTQPGVYSLTADSGTYNWTVSDAFVDYTMVAVYDTYALTGQDATLTFGAAPPENYSLTADAGSYSLLGRSARLTWSNEVVTTNGNYTISMSMKIGI